MTSLVLLLTVLIVASGVVTALLIRITSPDVPLPRSAATLAIVVRFVVSHSFILACVAGSLVVLGGALWAVVAYPRAAATFACFMLLAGLFAFFQRLRR